MRISVDFKRLEVTLEELAERLVMAAVKSDYQTLPAAPLRHAAAEAAAVMQ